MIAEAARRLLMGGWSDPSPPSPVPSKGVDKEPRDWALERLALYLSRVRYYRTGATGQPAIEFRIPRSNIRTEQPDAEKDLRFPSIAFQPGPGISLEIGLGAGQDDPSTFEVYGPQTVVVHSADYTERVVLEVWGSSIPERRAIMSGVRNALTSGERGYGIRMRLPKYFNAIAQYTLVESQRIDDADAVRNRRRGQLVIELLVPELQLVGINRLRPTVDVTTNDGNYSDINGEPIVK